MLAFSKKKNEDDKNTTAQLYKAACGVMSERQVLGIFLYLYPTSLAQRSQ